MLSEDLRSLGYEPTDKESPFDDNGLLWTKGYEMVCDETGIVIRKDSDGKTNADPDSEDKVYRYRNSENVKLAGGYVSSYDWGYEENVWKY